MKRIPGMTPTLAVHIQGYLTAQGMADIPITEADEGMWFVPLTGTTALADQVSVTLTANQWAALLAIIRAGTALSSHPGLGKLAHDTIVEQVKAAKPEMFLPKPSVD